MRTILIAAALAIGLAGAAGAQKPDIRVGVIYDYTGPMAAGGSLAGAIGTKIAIDMINERGGVEGHKIVAVNADTQSKADVALNEAVRLMEQEKVDLIMGLFSSAHCVPLASRMEAQKRFLWMNICTASAVVKGKNFQYAFRAQVHTDQFGATSCRFIADNVAAKLNKAAKDVKVAIIHEDGPYGVGVAMGNEATCKALGMEIVLKEGYAATVADLSALVTKLRRARPDIILHTGYNPDISLFLSQARTQGLRWDALIGHGAGYGQPDKLMEAFKDDANYIYNVDPVASQLLDAKTLSPGLGDIIAEMVKRYRAETNAVEIPPHVSMGFNQSWILFTDVMPRAIKKYGGYDAESLRKAALETDIPEGGTIQGYGVKFPTGGEMAGQSERSSPVVMQYIDGKTTVVWPTKIKTADPVLPLPPTHTYAKR